MNDQKGIKVYLWIIPSLICMSIIQFLPGVLSVIMSFTNLDVQYIKRPFDADFIGLQNYQNIFQPGTSIGNSFLTSVLATLKFTLFSTIIGYCLGLGAALLLNKEFRMRSLVRAIMIIPWIVPGVVSGFIWRLIFLRDYGILNKLLRDLNLINDNIFWLMDVNALWTIIIARTWSSFPFIMVSILAALQTIPYDYYEAAKIDGANAWQRFKYITMPCIATVSKVVVLLMFIWGTGEFIIPYVMFVQSPPPQANLLSVLVYQNAFQMWDFGGGAAISTVTLVIMLSISMLYMKVSMKNEK